MVNQHNVATESRGPLSGIRIVEYAIWHAGPGANAILSDMGAEVIKIESLQGDPERLIKQLGAVKFDADGREEWSFLFELSNRNKRGICLDITNEKGRRIFFQLIKSADVFLTNLRKSTKPKIKIDYQTLSGINPKLIHANISGYGPEGPMSDLGAFDPMGQAYSGMAFINGNNEPVLLQLIVLDQAASIVASHAIVTALFVREREGIGQEVHVSLYSTALWLMQANLLATSIMKKNPVVPWDRKKNPPLRNCFKCGDGKWIMGTNHPEQKFWPLFCELTAQSALIKDPAFADAQNRFLNNAELIAVFDKVFQTKPRQEWLEIFQKNGFMFAPVQQLEEVLDDPQANLNNYVTDFDHVVLGKIKLPGFPINFGSGFAGPRTSAPGLGEHTDPILKELGHSKQEIAELKQEGIIK